MKLTAFGILLFFICLNVSLYMINETAILPYWQQSPYEEPSGITGRLVHLDLTAENLVIGGTTLSVLIIIGYITGHLIFGGTVAIILFAFDLFFPVIKWIIFGLPTFLSQMGVPLVVYSSLTALISAVWFWFLLGFIAQRQLED
jgi:hypothetical protein